MIPAAPAYRLDDLGDRRVLTVGERRYATEYSARVLRMLIERKGPHRTPPYLSYKETRGRHFLGRLFDYLARRGARPLRVLEVGCSFGHITHYLAERPEVAEIMTFDTDRAFVEITRAQVADLDLRAVREVAHFTSAETLALPYADGAFDLVIAVGVVEHLPTANRSVHVEEYYRVVAPGGHVAILDTPNRAFPFETHSVGLPFVQWLPPGLAWRYARLCRSGAYAAEPFEEFIAEGTGWRNASFRECLPWSAASRVADVTEEAGYGWRFFRDTARSRTRRALLPAFAVAVQPDHSQVGVVSNVQVLSDQVPDVSSIDAWKKSFL
ncbi:MAG TPA: class I SAM-dependent methyltransferase, partial [Solirubrobacteraceae bacterium]